MDWIRAAWHRAKGNDLPNWAAVAFTAVIWPVALFLWHRRKVNGVPDLDVQFSPGDIKIGGSPYKAITILFANHTRSVVYVSSPRIRAVTKRFRVPSAAGRDVATDSYHMKFWNGRDEFDRREVTLQTNAVATTCMAAESPPDEFFTYRPSRLSRFLRQHKYFVLEYTALVGSTRYFVATRY